MSSSNKTKRLTRMALIAAIYTVLSMAIAPLSFMNWQFRVSEALTLLALLGFDEIYALTLGCFLTNLIGVMTGANGVGIMDIVFGTAATFIAGVLTYRFRNITVKGWPVLSALMPVIINGVIIGLELALILSGDEAMLPMWLTFGLEVAIGELGAVVILGLPLWKFFLEKQAVK